MAITIIITTIVTTIPVSTSDQLRTPLLQPCRCFYPETRQGWGIPIADWLACLRDVSTQVSL
jgi:hypothetical protein